MKWLPHNRACRHASKHPWVGAKARAGDNETNSFVRAVTGSNRRPIARNRHPRPQSRSGQRRHTKPGNPFQARRHVGTKQVRRGGRPSKEENKEQASIQSPDSVPTIGSPQHRGRLWGHTLLRCANVPNEGGVQARRKVFRFSFASKTKDEKIPYRHQIRNALAIFYFIKKGAVPIAAGLGSSKRLEQSPVSAPSSKRTLVGDQLLTRPLSVCRGPVWG